MAETVIDLMRLSALPIISTCLSYTLEALDDHYLQIWE